MKHPVGKWRTAMARNVMYQGLAASAIAGLSVLLSNSSLGRTEREALEPAASTLASFVPVTPAGSPNDASGNRAAIPNTSPTAGALRATPIAAPASSTANPSPANAPASASETLATQLAFAELLAVKIPEFSGLTGDYRINADETISVPVIGRVRIAGMTAPQLEGMLAQSLLTATGRQAHVTVEIAQYKPVFVTGYVMSPGSFPWKPNMTVLQAETKAGGVYRKFDRSTASSDGEMFRIQRTVNDLKRVLATLARLQAEQNEQALVTIPPRLVELVGRLEADKLIDAQSSSLVSRMTAFKAQMEALQRGIATGEKELAALRAQRERINEQVAARRTLSEQLQSLRDKKLVRIDRVLDEQAKLADLEEKITNVVVAVSRIQGTILGMQRDMVTLKYARQAAIDSEIFKLERDSSQYEIDLDAARRAHHTASNGISMPHQVKDTQLQYEIVSSDGISQKLGQDNRFAALRPGDTLIVKPAVDSDLMPTR